MGLSKADKQILGGLALAAGVAGILRQHYAEDLNKKTLLSLCERLDRKAMEAMDVCCPVVSKHEARAVNRTLQEYEQRVLPKEGYITIATAACMGILSDILDLVRNQKKRDVINAVFLAVQAVHRYHDRRGTHVESCDLGCRAADTWRDMFEVGV